MPRTWELFLPRPQGETGYENPGSEAVGTASPSPGRAEAPARQQDFPASSWHRWATAPEPTLVGCAPPTTGQTLAEPEPVGMGQDLPDTGEHRMSLQQMHTPACSDGRAGAATHAPTLSFPQGESWKGALRQWQSLELPPSCMGLGQCQLDGLHWPPNLSSTGARRVTPVLSWQHALGTSNSSHR